MGVDTSQTNMGSNFSVKTDRVEKLYHREQETDDSWQPSAGAVIKLLLSVRIAGALWSILRDEEETDHHWEPLHSMLYHKNFPSWKSLLSGSLADTQRLILNCLAFVPAYLFTHVLDQSEIAVFTLIRLTIGVLCIGAEYYAFHVISNRINISAGRYFLIFSIFSSGMFHASVTFSLHTVSMICSFFFLGGVLDDKRWLCYISWIISFTLGSWPTAYFFGLTYVAWDMWECTLHKKWIGKSLILEITVMLAVVLYSGFYAQLPEYLRTIYTLQSAQEYLSGVKISHLPPTPKLYLIEDIISNWNVAALLALFGPVLGCVTCWKFQKHREIWKKWNDPSPIIFLTINSVFWIAMFVFLGQHGSFLLPLYPNISLFAAITCDAFPRLWHTKEDDPVVHKSRKPTTDPFSYWPRTRAHRLVHALVGFYIICSLFRINTVYQSYGSEMDIYKGFTEELRAHEDLTRFHETIMLCHSNSSKRFTTSFFFPMDMQDEIKVFRLVRKQIIETDHIGIRSESFKDKSHLLDLCDYVVDIDKPSLAAGETSRETSAQWKPIISLPYLDADRTDTPFRFFSIPFFSSYFNFTHYTTITLYRRVV